jgi:tetratricopeptide (TPR) repeat protein
MPLTEYTLSKRLDSEDSFKIVELSEAETESHLGGVLIYAKRTKEAEEKLHSALKLDPRLGISRMYQGKFLFMNDKKAEGLEMLKSSVELDPACRQCWIGYVDALMREGKNEEAIEALQRTIAIKGDDSLYASLARLYVDTAQGEKAIDAISQAITLNPREASYYRLLSRIYWEMGNSSVAAAYAKVYVRLQGWEDRHSPYMALMAYLGFMEAGKSVEANPVLTDLLTNYDAERWPYPVAQFLGKKIKAEGLLSAATDNDKLTEAHTYIGMDALIQGDKESAITHFQWVRDNGNKKFTEYRTVLNRLSRIEKK